MVLLDSRFRGEVPDGQPRFRVGQLVRHRRYGYRGVVVGVDRCCRANEGWYHSNLTQPDREQPWYHVLVHGGEQTTYPAEENLMIDFSQAPVNHPLVPLFFSAFRDGKYHRNDTPWTV